jgi:2-polyprenyl-6-methoxyphenol hydroxylase-like FAD-dependent oxidoreductase
MRGRDHAVVIGGGIGGLLAARVLSESFERVTIVERDVLHPDMGDRRGVPQGRHVHGLQARGAEIVEELFPGLTAEAESAGAAVVEDLSRCHFAPNGHLLSQASWPMARLVFVTRPFLEDAVRRRVAADPRVDVADGTVVTGLLRDAPSDGSAVSVLGVRVAPATEPTEPRAVEADLVVDASGRAGRASSWLPELGYRRPEEERVTVRVRYASQSLRLPPAAYPHDMVIEGRSAERQLGMALFACEREQWTFTLIGTDASPPPDAHAGMVAAIGDLAPAWVTSALTAAEPIGPVSVHHFPASVRRRYDRLTEFPRGLLVFGDAICSFNPIYGQGMSVAAEQALSLRDQLGQGSDHDLARRFFRASARPIGTAWQLAVGSDLALPEVEGDRPLSMRLSSRYVGLLLAAAERDPEVARCFMRVAGLVDEPTALVSPRLVGRVLRAFTRPPARAATAARAMAPASAL